MANLILYTSVLGVLASLFSPPVLAQPWYDSMLRALDACREQAWRACSDSEGVACFMVREIARDACRSVCERELQERQTALTLHLRADEHACVRSRASHRERGFTCKDSKAWRQSEIAAREDAFDYAASEYPYLLDLTTGQIVERVYRVAEQGFIAHGGCAMITQEGRSITLLRVTALALNRVRALGPGSRKWAEAQAWALELLRRP